MIHLKTLIEQRDDKIERLTYILAERVPQAVLSLVMKDIKAIWPSEVEKPKAKRAKKDDEQFK